MARFDKEVEGYVLILDCDGSKFNGYMKKQASNKTINKENLKEANQGRSFFLKIHLWPIGLCPEDTNILLELQMCFVVPVSSHQSITLVVKKDSITPANSFRDSTWFSRLEFPLELLPPYYFLWRQSLALCLGVLDCGCFAAETSNETLIKGFHICDMDGTNHGIDKTNLKHIIPNMVAANTCLEKFVSKEIIASGWGIEGLFPLSATIIYVITLHEDVDLGCSSELGTFCPSTTYGSTGSESVRTYDTFASGSTHEENVRPSMVDMTVEMEKVSSLEDTTVLRFFPPLSTPITTLAGNALSKSSYANVIGKPSGKKLNIRTLFTQGGNGAYLLLLTISMNGLDAMLNNGPWFIRNHSFILKKWHSDENLLKEDVSTIPVWVKLYGVTVTAFSEDGLSTIATRLGTPLMLDSYTSDMCLQSWVFGHIHEECPKNLGVGEKKTLRKPSQTSRGVPVGPKIGFKPQKEYKPVPKKPTGSSSGNKKKGVVPTIEDEVASVDNDMARSMASERVGFGTQNLLEQWRDSYGNGDYDDDLYDDDIYEVLPQELQAICDNLDIRLHSSIFSIEKHILYSRCLYAFLNSMDPNKATKELLETNTLLDGSWGAFNANFSPEEYAAERERNNVQTLVQPHTNSARMNPNFARFPQEVIDQYDVQGMHSSRDSEVTRSPGELKKGGKKWLWSFIGMSTVIGALILAYSYAAHDSEHQSSATSSDTKPQAGKGVLDCGCFAAETSNETLIKGFHICDLMEVGCMLGYYMSKKYGRAAKVKIIDDIFLGREGRVGHGDIFMVTVVHPVSLDPNIALGLEIMLQTHVLGSLCLRRSLHL
nr:zinc knuckle CX2CX4HX4C [Tanacetum cinerariifolium]